MPENKQIMPAFKKHDIPFGKWLLPELAGMLLRYQNGAWGGKNTPPHA